MRADVLDILRDLVRDAGQLATGSEDRALDAAGGRVDTPCAGHGHQGGRRRLK